MRTYKYIGLFVEGGVPYSLTVNCNGLIQAFFLLTAKAINLGRHHQLATITDEDGVVTEVEDISKCLELLVPEDDCK